MSQLAMGSAIANSGKSSARVWTTTGLRCEAINRFTRHSEICARSHVGYFGTAMSRPRRAFHKDPNAVEARPVQASQRSDPVHIVGEPGSAGNALARSSPDYHISHPDVWAAQVR